MARLILHQTNGDEQTLESKPGETILETALRSGVAFPNSCRVGGCGTCKCRLTQGEVEERTDTSYLLSAGELERRTVLACQSVPRGDVHIEASHGEAMAKRAGVIVGQRKVTHDITELTVQLNQPWTWRSGQFVTLRLGGVARSYSFASPPSDEGRASFFIRRVEGGELSTRVDAEHLEGERVELEGPQGEMWLRSGDAPLLFVAGGSGLPPLLAMLEEALAAGDTRSATLVFGARTRADLYALERIEAVARAWKGRFRFFAVVQEEQGELVTDVVAREAEAGSHAYLCGPPGMIDATLKLLPERNITREDARFDRFTTRADAVTLSTKEALAELVARPRQPGRWWDTLKFFSFHLVGLIAVAALVLGGSAISLTLLSVVAFYILGDTLLGDDASVPRYSKPGVLTVSLWLALPLLVLIVFTSVWTVSERDVFGYGAWLSGLLGVDVLASRALTTTGQHVAAGVLTGLMIGMVGTIPAHELTHRTWDKVSMFVGRWLLAFSFDTSFSLEHVYGHHRYVATSVDPATAPRGRSVYTHILVSTWKGNVSAWHIERERLAKRKLPVLSGHNAFLRGHLMSVVLSVIAFAMGGPVALGFFVACALWGKALLEIVNYMEHYGIVRVPGQPVQPRHSWNTNRRISSWSLFNLTRHSHHHAQGEVPFQDLLPLPNAPMMLNGYLTTIVLALIPPLWNVLMAPRVAAWDRDFASLEELRLLRHTPRAQPETNGARVGA